MSETPGRYQLLHQEGQARQGVFHTRSAAHPTPMFMPVGTGAAVRGIIPQELKEMGASLMLANTYHLYLRPGLEVVAHHGGVGPFMRWDKGILTDSGGFQAFSLGRFVKQEEWGMRFQSHLDGKTIHLSPELVYHINRVLDPDCVMPLDVCLPAPASKPDSQGAVERTLRWLARSRPMMLNPDQVPFGIVQGGVYNDLRRFSARETVALGVPAIAIGGLSVGESKEATWEALAEALAEIPSHLVRYLMGMGTPEDLVRAVGLGADIFDCVLPTRIGRHGSAFTRLGRLALKQARFKLDQEPLDPACGCPVCQTYTRSYLRHLVMEKDLLGARLLTWHNLWFYQDLTRQMREAISQNRFLAFQRDFLNNAGHV